MFGQKPVAKIISIGPAMPDDRPARKGMFCVPFEVECGVGEPHKTGRACVQRVEGQPGRWRIDGF